MEVTRGQSDRFEDYDPIFGRRLRLECGPHCRCCDRDRCAKEVNRERFYGESASERFYSLQRRPSCDDLNSRSKDLWARRFLDDRYRSDHFRDSAFGLWCSPPPRNGRLSSENNDARCHWRMSHKQSHSRSRSRSCGSRSHSFRTDRQNARRGRRRRSSISVPAGCGGKSATGGKPRGSHMVWGEHRCTLENVPPDMVGLELKELSRSYEWSKTLTFARTYRRGGTFYGMLEFTDPNDMRRAIGQFDGKMIEGSIAIVRCYEGNNYNM